MVSRKVSPSTGEDTARAEESRSNTLLCWALFERGASVGSVCQITGITPTHALALKRARKKLVPEVRRAFFRGEIGSSRVVTISVLSRTDQVLALVDKPYRRRKSAEVYDMMHALLSVDPALRDARWQGAKEALAWVVGLGTSVAGLK